MSASAFVNETLRLNDHFSVNAGLRFDQFYYTYNNKLPSDTSLPAPGIYKASDQQPQSQIEFLLSSKSKISNFI